MGLGSRRILPERKELGLGICPQAYPRVSGADAVKPSSHDP